MVMGSGVRGLPGLPDGFRFGDHFPNPAGVNTYRFDGFPRNINGDLGCVVPGYGINPASDAPAPLIPDEIGEDGSHPHHEIFPDLALGYINKILMEEDVDEKAYTDQTDSAVLAAEKPFLDILCGAPPASPNAPPLYSDSLETSQDTISCPDHVDSGCDHGIGDALDGNWLSDIVCELHCMPELRPLCLHYAPQSPFSICDSNSNCNGLVEDRLPSTESFSDASVQGGHLLECQFMRGVEEARKFLPETNKLVFDLEATEFFQPVNLGECYHSCESGTRCRKNPYREGMDLEERRNAKQCAVMYEEEPIRSTMFDEVLLCNCGKKTNAVTKLREAMQSQLRENAKSVASRGPGGKSRGRKSQAKKEVIDLRTLLIHCAQYVATDDRRSANELLRQIRQHSSPSGDGTQRLAEIFANGLEARLAGTGSERYHSFMTKRQSASDVLKAYHLFIAACPFKRITHFFANQTILNVAENASKLHIVDFGINFGFQWPCLIHRLSLRPNGPLQLRITGIDTPQPGFRPSERLEETGRRLADYCKSFGVPFEYQHIATNWEDIEIEDLNLRKDEVLVVNCMYRLRHLADETVNVDSPRTTVLKKIRMMKPDAFIHGVVNGSFSAPFFVTRFREALFYYSSLFDMLDTTVPREQPERLLIETGIFGREAMNVIACEGTERIERPETYKQWQVRSLKAGFKQLRPNAEIMKKCRDRVRSSYHRDFLFDEDSGWLLQGWKGRIIFAVSTWRPDDKDL